MLIINEENIPIVLNSVSDPIVSNYMYVLDLNIMDFTLAPTFVYEEIICPTITLNVDGFNFEVPAFWNILIADEETSQLDIVKISNLAGSDFKALVYGINMKAPELKTITVQNYQPDFTNIAPSLNKHQMLCHPIFEDKWVNIAPTDSFNKYLKDKVIGDLI